MQKNPTDESFLSNCLKVIRTWACVAYDCTSILPQGPCSTAYSGYSTPSCTCGVTIYCHENTLNNSNKQETHCRDRSVELWLKAFPISVIPCSLEYVDLRFRSVSDELTSSAWAIARNPSSSITFEPKLWSTVIMNEKPRIKTEHQLRDVTWVMWWLCSSLTLPQRAVR